MEISQLGASGAVVIVVILFLKFMREEGAKRDHTYEKVAEALEGNKQAVAKADEYLRKRNGRDIEAHEGTLKAIKNVQRAIQTIPPTMQSIANSQVHAIITAVKVKEQHVTEQHVEHQTISKE